MEKWTELWKSQIFTKKANGTTCDFFVKKSKNHTKTAVCFLIVHIFSVFFIKSEHREKIGLITIYRTKSPKEFQMYFFLVWNFVQFFVENGKKAVNSPCSGYFFLDGDLLFHYNSSSARKKGVKTLQGQRRCMCNENDISAQEKTEKQRTRLQKKNENCKRQKSAGCKKKKRQKSTVRIIFDDTKSKLRPQNVAFCSSLEKIFLGKSGRELDDHAFYTIPEKEFSVSLCIS